MFKKIYGFVIGFLKNKYAKASLYYVIANIMGQGIVLISSAFFTRVMDKNAYGLVSTYSTCVLVVNSFICLNVYVTVRNAYIDFKDNYDSYCSSVLLLSILLGILMSIIIFVVSKIGWDGYSNIEIVLVCIQSISLNIINFILAIYSMKNQYKRRTLMIVLPNWVHITLSIVLILTINQNQYLEKIIGNAIGLFIFAIICTALIFKKSRPTINEKYWKYSLAISVPSIFFVLSELVLMQSDRLMLTCLVNAEETAEYSVIYNISSIIVVIYQAINGAWMPVYYRLIDSKQSKTVRRYEQYYVIVFTVFSCGIMTICPELIKIISPSNYWNGISYAGAIVIASYIIFLNSFYYGYLLFVKNTGAIARNSSVSALLNIGLNYLLIPRYYSRGAVVATVLSYLALHILHVLSVPKDGKKYLAISNMWQHLGGVMIYGLLFQFTKDIWFLRYLLYLVFSLSVIYINKNYLILFFKEITKNNKCKD